MNTASRSGTFSLPAVNTSLLPNGLKMHAVPKRDLPLASIHLIFPYGAEADLPGKAGLVDLMAEMLTLGTKKRPAARLAADVDALGATLSAHAGWESTSLHITGLSEDWEKLMELLLEIQTQPAFSPQEFDQLKQRRLAALTQQKDESQVIADECIQEILFQGTPYDHPVYGTLRSLPNLSCGEVEEFYRNHICREAGLLVMVGDLQTETCFRWVEAHFPPIPRAQGMKENKFSPSDSTKMKTIFIDRPDLTQSQIRLGHIGIPHAHPDFLPFEVMNYVFGAGGFSSRLMQRIRSEKGYTYGIRASLEPRKNPGPFIISTFTPTETTFPCVQEILEVENSFIAEGATDQERSEAIQFLTGSYPMNFETLSQIAQKIIQAEINGLGLEHLSSYPQRVSAVTREEMASAARAHLHSKEMKIVIVGRAEKFRKEFESWGPVAIRE
jgi:zinc protease